MFVYGEATCSRYNNTLNKNKYSSTIFTQARNRYATVCHKKFDHIYLTTPAEVGFGPICGELACGSVGVSGVRRYL